MAYSRKKTARSSWNVKIDPNNQFMNVPTSMKKLQPAMFVTPERE